MPNDPFVKLSEIYWEIKDKIKKQEDMFVNYENSIQSEDKSKRVKYYHRLKRINRYILRLLEDAKNLESSIVMEHGNSRTNDLFNSYLHEVHNKLQIDRRKISDLETKFVNSEAVNENVQNEANNVMRKYTIICILIIIVIIMTIRAFLYDPKLIDNIFFISALFLTMYHIFFK
tara:strand:- start:776 stop:1297 length:522 start_codon:yes stop_codon:yes gene_type:complete